MNKSQRQKKGFNIQKAESLKVIMVVLLLVLLLITPLTLFLKNFVYTDQYYWTNDLIKAIYDNNETEVKRLLQNKGMDVNKSGGVEFPWYLIPLDEYMREVPIETACWKSNSNIIKMLLDYGADENLDEAFALAVEYYDKEDSKIIKELLWRGASTDQNIEGKPILIWVAEFVPEDEADLLSEDTNKIEKNILEIFKTILEYSVKNKDTEKILKESLKAAERAENYMLAEYLNEVLKEYNE